MVASCWVWKAMWEERKRRQRVRRQKEESGHQTFEAAVAPKPLHFRLLDAVLFENGVPVMGVFTARDGELMRRTNTSLALPIVRSRMAQVSLAVSGGNDGGDGPPPISLAHLADGSTRAVAGGLEWDRFVSTTTQSCMLLALTPWAPPAAVRLRNSFRVVTEGSHFGKVPIMSIV